MPSRVPIAALTATATLAVQEEVAKSLLMERFVSITESPNRSNIKLINVALYHKEPYNSPESMDWLIQRLKGMGKCMPRTIMYCRSHVQCHSLFGIFESALGSNMGFAMYHASTHSEVQKKIIQNFEQEDGCIRLLFATIAFGMGVDVKGVQTILHMGVPPDVDDYVQESGRAGRDGKQSISVMLTYPGMYSKGMRVQQRMKDYANNASKCRRKLLMDAFGYSVEPSTPQHICCDVCASECPCDLGVVSCPEESLLAHLGFGDLAEENFSRRHVDSDMKNALHSKLKHYRDSLLGDGCSARFLAGKDLASGIPQRFITDIVLECDIVYPSFESFHRQYPFYDVAQARSVWEIVNSELAECPMFETIHNVPSHDSDDDVSADSDEQESEEGQNDDEFDSDTDEEKRLMSSSESD